jgi:hypothetical protein
LMLQLKIKNVPKNKKGVERRNFDQGVWGDEMNLMLNLHCNAMKFLRSTNALQWNNTWEIINKCKIINTFCFELFQLCDIVFKIVNACHVYNAFQLKIKSNVKVIQIKSRRIELDLIKCFEPSWVLVRDLLWNGITSRICAIIMEHYFDLGNYPLNLLKKKVNYQVATYSFYIVNV